MTNPQTEAQAIIDPFLGPIGIMPDEEEEIVSAIATALAAKDAELAKVRAAHQTYVGKLTIAERALAERAGGVKVKPLEWNHGYASVMFGGGYLVTYYAGMKESAKLETRGWWDGEPNGHFKTVDEAKAAAQADYERRILSALTHPAPTHNDGSVEDQPDPEECERTAAFWGAEATKAMLQGDGDEAKRCLARSKRHALNAVRIRAIASGGKP